MIEAADIRESETVATAEAKGHSDQRFVSKPVANLFGLSGGKDSTALWAWAINESGYPRDTIFGTACDTENEYDEVYDQIAVLDAYGQLHGVRPVRILTSIGFLNLAIKKYRFPSTKARFCTEELKIKPTQRCVKQLQEQGYEVVNHNGVRRSESTERSLLEEWGDSGTLGIKERRPLLDWTIKDVWDAHHKYGLPINPLYFTGRQRVGCKLCVMSNKRDIRVTIKTRPEVIAQYREWEKILAAERERRTEGRAHGDAGFMSGGRVPEIQRTGRFTSTTGKTFKIATIDDVARWAFTLHGGTQGGFDFMFDDSPIYELDDSHAPCKSGYCE